MGIRNENLFDYGARGDVADILSALLRIEGLFEEMAGDGMKLSAILEPLIAAGVSGDVILATVKAFEAEQTDALAKRRESDAKRQAEKRRRDESHVTSRDVTVTVSSHVSASPAPDLENKQTNKQENKIDASPPAQPKRGTRIPDDFEPDQIWAQSQGLSSSEALFEAEQFIDFWRSKPGKDGLKLDWPATWRTWVRNAIKRQTPRRSQGPPNRRRNYADVAMDRMNGNGPKGIFSTDGDAQRLPTGQRESGPDDGNLRSGLSRRFLASDH